MFMFFFFSIYCGLNSPSVGLAMHFSLLLYTLTCKECGRTRYLIILRYSLQIYVEGLWKCTINLSIHDVMDEIRVRNLQNVTQEYEILGWDTYVEGKNVLRWWNVWTLVSY
jgi:hypothetical protein